MSIYRVKFRSVVGFMLFSLSTFATADWNPQPGWQDSYAVGGVCYCNSSNYDHNLSSKSADTPQGRKNVVQICNDIKNKLGTGPTEGRIPYNDIQCGHGPANDAADEAGCPGRVDIGSSGCDVKGPRWDLQAVYGDEPVTETEVETVTSAGNESCAVVTESGASYIAAKQLFEASCPGLQRQDCDPVSGNRWMCSTDNINASTPVQPSVPSTSPQPNPEPITPTQPAVPTGDVCEAQGSSLGAARQAYAQSCPDIPREDCDPTGNNQWTCSSAVIGDASPNNPNGGGIETPTEETPTEGGTIGRVGSNDLVALHYDNCPDRDDGHALAAGKAVVFRSGLQNILVVNGTCSDRSRNAYQPSSEIVARAVWGNQWLDAANDLDASIQISAQRWADVLANGADVWVAEGGPSDFTAKVLRSIANQFPSLNLKKVHVVQHSTGDSFNEAQTTSENIGLIKREADYVPIPNGNAGGNGSAGLRNNSSFFVETARQSEFSNEWDAAFNYLNPNERLDFSDTVELLYMIDDTVTQTVDDFARNYLR